MLNSSISLLNGSSPYALKSIQLAPIAQKQGGLINTMLSLTKSVFGSTAEAFTIPPANPLAQTLSPGSTAAFVILWNPIANIAVSPAAMPLTAAAGGTASGQVQVSNTGAPGSTLTWSSSIAYTNGSGWLSVSPASDATGLTNGASGNASENATITANAAGLAVGTYTGTVTFTGDSTVWPSPGPLVNTVTVTFTVTGIGGSGYDCANNACSSVGSGAQYGSVASCDAACGFSGSVSGMTVSCNPSSIYTNGTSTCTATVDGSGGYSSGVIWSATAGTIDQSGNYTGPGTTGTVTVTATSEQDPTQSGQTEITVNTAPPPTCNGANCQAVCSSPTLTASPSSIVVPESSSLTYGCSNVTQCTLTGGGLDETQTLPTPGTITGSATTTPSMTTTYTLTCVNGDYSSDSTNASVQVVVGGSSLCEQNPNGAGCSGQ